MGRVVVTVGGLLVAVVLGGCSDTYDCDESCELMRSCGRLVGTAIEACEVRCIQNEADRESAIDECGACLDDADCSADCVEGCVCALSLDTAEYSGVVCTP